MYLQRTLIRQPQVPNIHYINPILMSTTLQPIREIQYYRTTQNEPTVKSALTSYCKKFTKDGPSKVVKKYRRGSKHRSKDEEPVEKRRKERETGTIWIEECPDIFWPTIPGVDGPIEESAEPVGNLNKPPKRDPEEEEKYKNLYVPTHKEVYEQFQHWPPYELKVEDDDFQDADEDADEYE